MEDVNLDIINNIEKKCVSYEDLIEEELSEMKLSLKLICKNDFKLKK